MSDHEQRIAFLKIGGTWTAAGAAKGVEMAQYTADKGVEIAASSHGFLLFGLSIADWAGLAALIFTVMQIMVFAPRWGKAVKEYWAKLKGLVTGIHINIKIKFETIIKVWNAIFKKRS